MLVGYLAFQGVWAAVNPAMPSARYGIDLKRPAKPTPRSEGFEPVQQIFLLPGAVPSWLLIWGQRKD